MITWQILLTITIVVLSIILPIYYSHQKKIEKLKLQNQLKESKHVTEREKIRVYIDNINEKYRAKRR